MAKGMAGGVPMGAVACSEKIGIPSGKHGTTFGANPLACAAGIAAIQFMKENKLEQAAQEKGRYILDRLQKMESGLVREVRGIGLIIGIELKEKSKPYILSLMEKGVMTLPAGLTVVRLLPPLTISYEEIDFVLEKLKEVLGKK
jgi:acetylornithine/LysW-gamma-L-lysine aminotransferase